MMFIVVSLLISFTVEAKSLTKSQFEVAKDIIWAADKADVPRPLLLAVCWGEGSFRRDDKLTHTDGNSLSHGTCQVKLETAKFMDSWFHNKSAATHERLENTKVNAFYAGLYLKYWLKKHDYNWQKAVDSYNKGRLVSAQSKYVKKVESNHKMLTEKLKDLMFSTN